MAADEVAGERAADRQPFDQDDPGTGQEDAGTGQKNAGTPESDEVVVEPTEVEELSPDHAHIEDSMRADPDRPPRGLALWGVVLLGLGVGYLAANVVAEPAWLRTWAWLAAASAVLVGVLWLVWVRRPSARGWVRALMALLAWVLTMVAAASFGLTAMLSEGTLHPPGPVAGNCFLAAVTVWLGAWVLGHAERSRLRRQVGALTDAVADLEVRLGDLESHRGDLPSAARHPA